MKIQYVNGGLANQAFQYIFARFCELENPGEKVWLDDSFFFVNQIHNGYELEKVFGIKANLLSQYFTPDVWEYLMENKKKGISIPQSFKDMGEDIIMVAESGNWREHNPFDGTVRELPECNVFVPGVAKETENVYYHGYWVHKNWLESHKTQILSELAFPPLTDQRNLEYQKEILERASVAVHVRRGDYVTLGWQMPEQVYLTAVNKILEIEPDAVFFVFSDDIGWCRENAGALGLSGGKRVVYVEGNVQGNNYIDMQLMSLCKEMIISNSAFGFLAALLNKGKQYWINLSQMKA